MNILSVSRVLLICLFVVLILLLSITLQEHLCTHLNKSCQHILREILKHGGLG